MENFASNLDKLNRQSRRLWLVRAVLLPLVVVSSTGCSIMHPVRGVPASYLPDEFEGPKRSGKRTINPSLLVQTPPAEHRIAAGDVLSIYIPGVLGRREAEVRQFGVEPPINQPYTSGDPPTIGYPIAVRDDHTIALPQIPPINVYNKTLHEAELAIRRAYTQDFKILQPDEAMILVSLQRPRVHRVLVVRQETGNELADGGGAGGTINLGVAKRGTARIVTLNAYENDVLHALATVEGVDGLPGLDAENTIYIIRRRQNRPVPLQPPHQAPASNQLMNPMNRSTSNAAAKSPFITADYRTAAQGSTTVHGPIREVGHSFSNASSPSQPQLAQHAPTLPTYGQPTYNAPQDIPSAPPIYLNSNPSPYGYVQPPMHALPPTAQTMPPQQSGPQLFSPALPVPPSMSTENLIYPENEPPQWSTMLESFDPTIDNPNVVKIPIRLAPGEQPHITEDMITLNDGDIVFIESRETDVFYTGGLLGGGQYTLPREYDLGVLEAISIAEGRNASGGANTRAIGGVSALNRDVSVSASRVIILRTLPTGQRITVEVDLHKAMKYQQENILVQPGDMLLLQYTAGEAIGAFTQRYILEGALFSLAAAQFNSGG